MLGVSAAAAVPSSARHPALPPRLPHEVTLQPLIGQYSHYCPLIGQGDPPCVCDPRGEPLSG